MKKKHLSAIVIKRLAFTILGAFLALMIVTTVFVYLYARNNIESLIRFQMEDLKTNVYQRQEETFEDNLKYAVLQMDRYIFPQIVEEYGEKFWENADFQEWINGNIDGITFEELFYVDKNGIVFASSDEEHKGFDLNSNEETKELFLEAMGEGASTSEVMDSPMEPGTLWRYGAAYSSFLDGLLAEGYTNQRYLEGLETNAVIQIRHGKIGRTGSFLLLDSDDTILASAGNLHNGDRLTLSHDPKELAKSGNIVKEDVFGTPSYVGVLAGEKDYLVGIYPAAEAWETWNTAILVFLLIYVLISVILFLFLHRLINKEVVRGVYSLNDSLSCITKGNLEEKADFRESIEFDELSNGINHTVDRLKELIKEAEERNKSDLELAATIQNSFIPHDFPAFPERDDFELYAEMIPAKEVGGDFYDYFLIDEDHLALVMADVSGKGIPAAMFMASATNKIRTAVKKHGADAAGAIVEVNREILKENDAQLFVTVWLGVVTLSTGHVDYVNAGHTRPALKRQGEKFIRFHDVHNVFVGMVECDIKAGSFDLKNGEFLYLYTDGVTEAQNEEEELFGNERMLGALNQDGNVTVQEMDAAVRAAVAEFVKDEPQFDDMTSLCFLYKGKGSEEETSVYDWFAE